MVKSIEVIYSPNSKIDAAIKEMLPDFDPGSQKRMKRKILNAKKAAEKHRDDNTDAEARHVFREFIPASILNRNGYTLEYETSINGKTPDWLDSTSKLMLESYTFERGGSSRFLDRVKSSVADKCDKYEDIITDHSLRFVISVYLDFWTTIEIEECCEDSAAFRTTFDESDCLWGILFFTEQQRSEFSIVGQPYGFFCLTTDGTHETMPGWPFPSADRNFDFR